MNLHDLDLNLLVLFEAIYKEGGLTLAGKKLGLTQSAMSHALSRLRHEFNDQLFIRQGNRMIPTSLAEEMILNVKEILRLIRSTIEDKGCFAPERSTCTFVIGLNDYTAMILLPTLLGILQGEAPSVCLKTRHLTLQQRKVALEDGSVDMVIGSPQEFGANIYQRLLFNDRNICLVSTTHPTIGDTLSLEQYISSEFIKLSLSDLEEDPIDSELKEKGLVRQIMVTVEHEVLIPQLVAATNYIANMGELISRELIEGFPVKILPIPLKNTDCPVFQFWHARNQLDPAHRWFRKIVLKVAGEIGNRTNITVR